VRPAKIQSQTEMLIQGKHNSYGENLKFDFDKDLKKSPERLQRDMQRDPFLQRLNQTINQVEDIALKQSIISGKKIV
jgi:hypothetical protein